MKKQSLVIIAVVLALFVAVISFADGNTIKLVYNGVRLALLNDNGDIEQPIIQDGQVYVPLKSFIETIGGTYEYDEESATVSVTLDNGSKQEGSTTTSKKKIEITKDNFLDYFKGSYWESDYTNSKSEIASMTLYQYSDYVNLTVDAKQPFEIYNVQFSIKFNLKTTTGEDTLYIDGTIPQSGSFSGKKEYEWSEIYSGSKMKIDSASLVSASGYIMIDE